MKKWVKGCLIASGVLMAAGAIMVSIGVTAGGVDIWERIRGGEYSLYRDEGGIYWGDFDKFDARGDDEFFRQDEPVYNGDFSKTLSVSPENLKKLDLEIERGMVNVEESYDDKIHVEGENVRKAQWYVKGDELKVKVKDRKNDSGTFYLYLPKGIKFQEIEADTGMGSLYIAKAAADSMEVSVDMGEMHADSLEADRTSIDVGMGYAYAEEIKTGSLDVEVDMGNADVTAEASGNINMECGMGEITADLSGSRDDYSINLDGNGSFEIGGESYSGLGVSRNETAPGKQQLKINCDMGSVTVYFAE